MSGENSEGWKPEDGAGYMPTEERNSDSFPKDELRKMVEKARENAGDTTSDLDHVRWVRFADELGTLLNE